jgi:hypothetical protein
MFEEDEMKRFREHNFMIARFMVRGFAGKKPKEEHDE